MHRLKLATGLKQPDPDAPVRSMHAKDYWRDLQLSILPLIEVMCAQAEAGDRVKQPDPDAAVWSMCAGDC